jgi:hypothetical protein
MMSEIMEVPLPRACVKRLMSFLTFHISMFFSASLACCCSLILAGLLLLCEPWDQRLRGGLVSRNVLNTFSRAAEGPERRSHRASRCSGSGGGDAGPVEGSIWRNKYLQVLRREWVGRGRKRVDGVAVTRRVCGERKLQQHQASQVLRRRSGCRSQNFAHHVTRSFLPRPQFS